MDRGARWAIVHEVTKSRKWLKQLSTAHRRTHIQKTKLQKHHQYQSSYHFAQTLLNGQIPYVSLVKIYHFKKSLVLPGEQILRPCWIILGIKIGWNFAIYNTEISCQIRYTPPIKKIQCTGQHNMFILLLWHFRKLKKKVENLCLLMKCTKDITSFLNKKDNIWSSLMFIMASSTSVKHTIINSRFFSLYW